MTRISKSSLTKSLIQEADCVNGPNLNHDKIRCHDKDTFRAIQLRVAGSAMHFDQVLVYGNHNQETLPVRNQIRARGSTKALDLRGGNRDIAYVELLVRKGTLGSSTRSQAIRQAIDWRYWRGSSSSATEKQVNRTDNLNKEN